MLFNSSVFVLFFLIIYTLYLSSHRNRRLQNFMLVVASYIFYGYWDPRFLALILLSTVIDFYVGRALDQSDETGRRKFLVNTSVVANLTILGFFKYFDFFSDGAVDLLSIAGFSVDRVTLDIVLPVGISFYTFQTMSYTIDIYRRRLHHTDSFLDFALFVSFFPQLVAGPIERAVNLLPQIAKPRRITMELVNAGLFLILWGYFKKVVIADNMAIIANTVFNSYESFYGLDIAIGTIAFAFQIYADFSGYSDIARGISKLLGIELMVNFKLPYFALNPSDFWQRWHISLSSWLRDYIYVPLGGNRGSGFATYRNLSLTMLLGGLWHGAAWNFVIWGAFHGAILVGYRLLDRNPEHMDPWGGDYSRIRIVLKMTLMLTLTMVGWVIFRSQTVDQIVYMLTNVGFEAATRTTLVRGYEVAFFTVPLLAVQLAQYVTRDLLIITKLNLWWRSLVYGFLLTWIAIFGITDSTEFIYFQF
jgi:alginate O-acetyltransferase complex protein AlgI